MAKFTMTDCYISINGVVLSDEAKSVSVEASVDSIDFTAFGATNKVVGKGLGDAKITVEFFQDFAAGKVHATLAPLSTSTTPFSVEVRPTSAARSTTNPAMLLTALMFGYNPLSGAIGEASTFSTEFQNASQTGLTFASS